MTKQAQQPEAPEGEVPEGIIRKIQKLQAHADNNKSEVEAQTYAAAVQKLLQQYRLSLTDIEFGKSLEDEKPGQSVVMWKNHPDTGHIPVGQRIMWIEQLASIVARAYGCYTLVIPGRSWPVLYGREHARKAAEYTIVTLVRAANKLAKDEHHNYYRRMVRAGTAHLAAGYRDSFLTGFVQRTQARLDEELGGGPGSTALVRWRKEFDDARDAAQEACEGKKNAKSLSRHRAHNSAGYDRGIAVANGLDLRGRAFEGKESEEAKCSNCNGVGRSGGLVCPACRGKGHSVKKVVAWGVPREEVRRDALPGN